MMIIYDDEDDNDTYVVDDNNTNTFRLITFVAFKADKATAD